MTEALLGARHQRVQRLRRLLAQRAKREGEHAFVIEGAKVLAVALDAQAGIEAVYYAPEAKDNAGAAAVIERAQLAGIRTYGLAAGVIDRVADTVNPQPVLAVVATNSRPLADVMGVESILCCCEVRDPGNVGAILRSAHGAGIGAVALSDQCADVYNPKTVRASAGSIFHVPIAQGGTPSEMMRVLHDAGYRVLGASSHGGRDYALADYSGKVALVLGNEAHGLAEDHERYLDEALHIPTADESESLNVAMAATVLCFELARARRLGGVAPH